MDDETVDKPVYPGMPVHYTWHCWFTYTNWRGETRLRKVGVISMWHGVTQWHKEPQWLMHAMDMETGEIRDFAMRDMKDVRYERTH